MSEAVGKIEKSLKYKKDNHKLNTEISHDEHNLGVHGAWAKTKRYLLYFCGVMLALFGGYIVVLLSILIYEYFLIVKNEPLMLTSFLYEACKALLIVGSTLFVGDRYHKYKKTKN